MKLPGMVERAILEAVMMGMTQRPVQNTLDKRR